MPPQSGRFHLLTLPDPSLRGTFGEDRTLKSCLQNVCAASLLCLSPRGPNYPNVNVVVT